MKRAAYLSTIAADIGDIFVLVAPITCLPLIVAVLFSEWPMLLPMATVPLLCLLSGHVLKRLPRNEREHRLSTAMCSVALFWFACAAISGIPFMLGLQMSFTDALFEGMAGWTGTAFSMTRALDTVPHTLLFWRSFMQWIGGIGIIAFSVAMAGRSGLFPAKLHRTEGRDEPLMPGMVAAGRSLYKIYGLLTFLAIGLVLFSGLSLWESVNLALGAISTGGFTLHSGGILYYQSVTLELLLIPVMIAGALPFRLYFLIVQKRCWSLFGDEQVKLFFTCTVVGTLILTADLLFFHDMDLVIALKQGLFMTVSALSTTGFQNANLHTWASTTLLFLAMIIFIGGAAGSTAGGIKLNRVAFAFHGLVWWFRRVFASGRVLIPLRIEGRMIPKATAELETAKNMLVIILSVTVIFVATLCVLQFYFTSYPTMDVLFDTVSAFSTCGLSTGYVSYEMPVFSKWIFILVMWVGRLEVIPVVMLFVALFRGPG
jgi:trk system potassium uptake protein TrkH